MKTTKTPAGPFYVVSTENVGPSQGDRFDPTHGEPVFEIRTAPATGNMSPHPVILNGWCGTTNDWSERAHGEFDRLAAARAKCEELGGTVRWDDDNGDPEVIERYTTPCGARGLTEACDWLSNARAGDLGLTADTTDEQLKAIAEQLEEDALSAVDIDYPHGLELTGALDFIRGMRNELRDA